MIPKGFCECGCGQPAPIASRTHRKYGWVKGEPMRFVLGHSLRATRHAPKNGGLTGRPDGRTQIVCRDNARVYFYRAVMEAHLGRHLLPSEIVHHKNGDSTDDRLENLELLSGNAEHARRHAEMRKAAA